MPSSLPLLARIQVRGKSPEHAVFGLDGRRQGGGSPVGELPWGVSIR